MPNENIDDQLHLMSAVDELLGDEPLTNEDIENMLDELRNKYSRRIRQLAD